LSTGWGIGGLQIGIVGILYGIVPLFALAHWAQINYVFATTGILLSLSNIENAQLVRQALGASFNLTLV
jgi:hypothetical protein